MNNQGKETLMEQLTARLKALSDRNRLRMVAALLLHEELCGCQLTDLIQVSAATASRHLGILIASSLVDSRKEGRWVYYRLRRELPELRGLIAWIEDQLLGDPVVMRDLQSLEAITSVAPELLCNPLARTQSNPLSSPGVLT
jgi:ArsR family transcriptional regulator